MVGKMPTKRPQDNVPTLSEDDFLPGKKDRAYVSGINDSGKTYLIKAIVVKIAKREKNERFFIFDSKGTWPAKPFFSRKKEPIARLLPKNIPLRTLPAGIYVYKSQYPDNKDPYVKKLFAAIFALKKCTVIIDEVNDFQESNGKAMPLLAKLIRQGRELEIRMIIGSQSPMESPLVVMRQSRKYYIFYLREKGDRDRICQMVGKIDFESLDENRHDFYFFNGRAKRSEQLVKVLQIE